MKKFYFLALAAAVGISASAQDAKTRAAFATGISHETTEGVTTVKFNLTGNTATGANLILIKDNAVVKTIPLTDVAFGANSIVADLSDVEPGKYNYSIEVISEIAGKSPVKVYGAATTANQRNGITIVNDTESDSYGTVVVAKGKAGFGMDIIAPDATVTTYLNNASPLTTWSSHISAYSRKGQVLIGSWADGGSGIFCYDPATPKKVPFQIFAGTRASSGLISYEGKPVGGSIAGMAISYDGTKLYTIDEEVNDQDLSMYEIGDELFTKDCLTAGPTWKSAVIKTGTGAAAGADGSPLVRDAAFMTATTPYGIMFGQARGQADKWPYYVFWNPATDKSICYRADNSVFTSSATGCAFNSDYTLFAHVAFGAKGIEIHEVNWTKVDDFMYPEFSEPIYTVPFKTGFSEVVFDAADNVYACSNQSASNVAADNAYVVYALPGKHTAKTPAKAADFIEVIKTSGIAAVETETEAPVYYNLQGARVINPQGGIFIEVHGAKATKVVK